MKVEFYTLYVTFADDAEAGTIIRTLVDERLIACGNILGTARSIFRWEGKVQEEDECVAILKTGSGRLDAALERLVELHSYDTPGIEVFPVTHAPQAFVDWVREETGCK